MTRLALAVLAVVLIPAWLDAQNLAPVRVFVFAAENDGGFQDVESKARQDAALDLRAFLGRQRKHAIEVIDSREHADVVVEVLGRAQEETGGEVTRYSRFGSTTAKAIDYMVRTTLSIGDYNTNIVGTTKSLIKKDAAHHAGRQIVSWIEKNRERVTALRVTSK